MSPPLHCCPSHFLEWTHFATSTHLPPRYFRGSEPFTRKCAKHSEAYAASPCLSSPLFPIWMLAFRRRLCVFRSVLVYSRCPWKLSLSGSFNHPSPFLHQHPQLSRCYMVIVQHTGCLSWLHSPPPTAEGARAVLVLGSHAAISAALHSWYIVKDILLLFSVMFVYVSVLCGYVHTGIDVYRGQRHLILLELELEAVVKPNSILCKSRKRL